MIRLSCAFPPCSNIWLEQLFYCCAWAILFLPEMTAQCDTHQCGNNIKPDVHLLSCFFIVNYCRVALSFKCVLIPDWRWAAWAVCICRTGRWKPVFPLWWRPRIYCPDSLQSYDPSAEEGTLRRCRQSQRRSPEGQETFLWFNEFATVSVC